MYPKQTVAISPGRKSINDKVSKKKKYTFARFLMAAETAEKR